MAEEAPDVNATRWTVRLAGLLFGLFVLAIVLSQEGPVPAQALPVLVAQCLLLLCSLAAWRWPRGGGWSAVAAALLLGGAVLRSGLVTAARAPGYGLGASLLGAALLALPQLLLALALVAVVSPARPGLRRSSS
jgi:hypothetical protein